MDRGAWQEYWSGLPCPPPGDLPDLGIEPASLRCPALAGGFFTTSATCSLVTVKVKSLSCVRLFATPWTGAYQAPPSMGFSRQEYWSGLSFPSPGDLPGPGIKPKSPTFQADALTSELPGQKYYLTSLNLTLFNYKIPLVILSLRILSQGYCKD